MSVDNAVTMAKNRNFRMAAVEATPQKVFAHLYNRLMTGEDTYLTLRGGRPRWQLELPDRSVRVVRAQDAVRITHIGPEPQARVYRRYTVPLEYQYRSPLPDAFEPQEGDTVVDVGAFIGEFSWGVTRYTDAKRVVAIEPDPRSRACLDYNLPEWCEIEAVALGESDEDTIINTASDPSESGLLTPDKGYSERVPVAKRRLDTLFGAGEIDFCKVEAEGYEPEVLAGMGDLRPPKVVVNVSPERDGESPAPECTEILHERGYATKRRGHELFAWLE